MPAETFLLPFRPAIDPNGLTVSGAKLWFYVSGTSTPQAVFADEALTVPLLHPVMANAAGKWPTINLDNTLVYRVVLTDELGTVLSEADPYTVNVTDPLEADLQAFVDAAAAQATNAGGQAVIAANEAAAAVDSAAAATAQATSASESAALADFAAQQAGMYSSMYPSTSAGIADTEDGRYFSIPDTDEDYAILYQNDSGVAVEINRYPSASALTVGVAAAAASASGAAGSATSALGSATTATTKASEASTSAGTASTQAGIATTGATTATTQAGIATTQAGTATTKAGEASASAAAAAASATDAESTFNAPWIAFTPTVTSSAGAGLVTAGRSGKYRKIGKSVFFQINWNITNNGSASGFLVVSMPIAAASGEGSTHIGVERAIGGKALRGYIDGSSSSISVLNFDGTYPGVTGGVYNISGSYAVA